jgi:hypothetical protein
MLYCNFNKYLGLKLNNEKTPLMQLVFFTYVLDLLCFMSDYLMSLN